MVEQINFKRKTLDLLVIFFFSCSMTQLLLADLPLKIKLAGLVFCLSMLMLIGFFSGREAEKKNE